MKTTIVIINKLLFNYNLYMYYCTCITGFKVYHWYLYFDNHLSSILCTIVIMYMSWIIFVSYFVFKILHTQIYESPDAYGDKWAEREK